MQKFRIYTFGCKSNQYDSAYLENVLRDWGFESVGYKDTPDFIVVNACTVTGSADSQARQLFRRLRGLYPSSKIFASGCYARLSSDQINSTGAVDSVFESAELDLAHQIRETLGMGLQDSEIKKNKHYLKTFPGRTRAFIKVQDGCDSYCSFCIVPFARGRPRSVRREDVLRQIGIFARQGYKEVVLTGIHLGIYGRDLQDSTTLLELLKVLEDESPVRRIRLSSIEPDDLGPELIKFIAGSEVINNHLHLPLQSGDDKILKAMNRKYSARFFSDRIREIASLVPGCGLGTDVLVGFPGETRACFSNTLNLVEGLPLTYIHVFPFSKRKGTRAYHYKNAVDSKIVKERCKTLRELGEIKKNSFKKSLVNSLQSVLIEDERSDKIRASGFSKNYVRVLVDGHPGCLVNAEVDVKIYKMKDENLYGEIYEEDNFKIDEATPKENRLRI